MADEGGQYPIAASLIDKNFYVDDFICSCDNIDQANLIYQQLTAILMLGAWNRYRQKIELFQTLSHLTICQTLQCKL